MLKSICIPHGLPFSQEPEVLMSKTVKTLRVGDQTCLSQQKLATMIWAIYHCYSFSF